MGRSHRLVLGIVSKARARRAIVVTNLSMLLIVYANTLIKVRRISTSLINATSHIARILLIIKFTTLTFVHQAPGTHHTTTFHSTVRTTRNSRRNLLGIATNEGAQLMVTRFILKTVVTLALVILLNILVPRSRLP